jgi:dihydrofolate synthase/folylpolyglutamate synthase
MTALDQVTDRLKQYAPVGFPSGNYSLTNIRRFLASIGNPQDHWPSVHIAGTSGKTSTAYFIRSMLTTSGCRTGLTISPHMISITERVQINGVPLDDFTFTKCLSDFLDIVTESGIELSYFEVLTAFAYHQFARSELDYVIVETGLGGLHDATNCITRQDKLCLISDIGFDHVELLGSTIEQIALQKAGIAHSGNHVIMQNQDPKAVRTVQGYALREGASFELIPRTSMSDLIGFASFAQRNLTLAAAGHKYLVQRDSISPIANEAYLKSIESVAPGRLEVRSYGRQTLILDGAHNEQKMASLVKALMAEGKRLPVLCNLIESSKQKLVDTLTQLKPICLHLLIPEFKAEQDVLRNSFEPALTADVATELGFPVVEVVGNVENALEHLRRLQYSEVLVTGSLYLVGDILRRLDDTQT